MTSNNNYANIMKTPTRNTSTTNSNRRYETPPRSTSRKMSTMMRTPSTGTTSTITTPSFMMQTPPTRKSSRKSKQAAKLMMTAPPMLSSLSTPNRVSRSVVDQHHHHQYMNNNNNMSCNSPSINKWSSSSSNSNSDRFIPNRSQMNVDLCRASLLSAEKRRSDTIEKVASSRQRRRRLADNNSQSPSTVRPNEQPPSDHETALQTEFRRRMKGALLDINLDDMSNGEGGGMSGGSSSSSRSTTSGTAVSSKENVVTSGNLASIISPYLSTTTSRNNDYYGRTNLAYATIHELEAEERQLESLEGGTTPPRGVPKASIKESETRLLSFRGPEEKNIHHDVGSSTPQFMNSAADPYAHDQLHVLQRSASKSSYGRYMTLNGDDTDNFGLQSIGQKVGRRIPSAPTRILDAPDIVDDYYLNLISWSEDNILAVALGPCVYLWDANTGGIQHLVTLRGADDYVTSVSWSTLPGSTKFIAVGTNGSAVQLWDSQALKKVRTLNGHSNRVSSLSWNQHCLSTGGRDSLILQHDVRTANNVVSTYRGHTQEVCGLKWNDDGTSLASGGNENYLCIWDAAMSRRDFMSRRSRRIANVQTDVTPRLLLTQHKAAVKALAWCPFHRGLLASGGGTADRTIKFWNTSNGTNLNSIDTGSQVCSLLWSKHQRELCSSHGFSENQLILWKYPTMTKIQEFKGHTSRVLHMEQSPDGASVVSAAADETLRFWDLFGPPPRRRTSNGLCLGDFSAGVATIR